MTVTTCTAHLACPLCSFRTMADRVFFMDPMPVLPQRLTGKMVSGFQFEEGQADDLKVITQQQRERIMPYVNLQITKGASREQKNRIVAEFTATLVTVLGKKPEHTHIVIQEIDQDDWGFAGMLTSDWKRQQG